MNYNQEEILIRLQKEKEKDFFKAIFLMDEKIKYERDNLIVIEKQLEELKQKYSDISSRELLIEGENKALAEQIFRQQEKFFEEYKILQSELISTISKINDQNLFIQKKDEEIQHLIENYNKDLYVKDSTISSLQEKIRDQIIEIQFNQQNIIELSSIIHQKESDILCVIDEKNMELAVMQASKFWKLRDFYMSAKWAVIHPLKFIKKYVWSGMRTYSDIRWALKNPLKFSRKYIWKKTPTYQQVMWATHNPKQFLRKYYKLLVSKKEAKPNQIVTIGDVEKFQQMCCDLIPFISNDFPVIDVFSEKKSLLVETRNLPHLEFVIKNTIQKLGDGWGHIIFCSRDNHANVKNICKSISSNIEIFVLEKQLHTKNDFNNLLLSSDFWDKISCEKVLVYQPDTFIFKQFDDTFLEWDYIGSPWAYRNAQGEVKLIHKDISTLYNLERPFYTGNGGFSLRSVSMMKEIVNSGVLNDFPGMFLMPELDYAPEDVIISVFCNRNPHKYRVPPLFICEKFSFEIFYNTDSFACHQPYSYIPFDSIPWRERYIMNTYNNQLVQTKPIYVFFHAWLVNDWEEIVDEQIEYMKESGLYDAAARIYISYTSTNEVSDIMRKKYGKYKKIILKHSIKNEYEFSTLDLIKKISREEDFKGVYFHTKGVFYDEDHTFKKPTKLWRRYLNHYVINLWKYNLNILDSFDIVGCQYRKGTRSSEEYWKKFSPSDDAGIIHPDHFSGNFWWFNSTYVRKIPDLSSYERTSRHNAEWYIFRANPKFFNWRTDTDVFYFNDGIKNQEVRKKKKIAIVHVCFAPQTIGGATRVVEDQVSHLIEEYPEYEICVFTTNIYSNDNLYQLETYQHKSATIYRTAVPLDSFVDFRAEDIAMYRAFQNFLLIEKPDLVHFHCIQRLTGSIVDATIASHIPYIVTVHDAWWISDHQFLIDENKTIYIHGHLDNTYKPKDGITIQESLSRRKYLKSLLLQAENVFVVSKAFATLYQNQGIPCDVNTNGISSSIVWKEKNTKFTEKVVCGFVSGFFEHKGFFLFKEAVLCSQPKNISILLIDHAKDKTFRSETQWGSVPVVTIGKQDQSDVANIYQKIDVIFTPSIWPESFGLISREAAAAGCFVVASNRGAIAEDIEDGVNGFVIEPTIESIIFSINTIDNNPLFYKSIFHHKNIKNSKEQCSEMVSVYQKILKKAIVSPNLDTASCVSMFDPEYMRHPIIFNHSNNSDAIIESLRQDIGLSIRDWNFENPLPYFISSFFLKSYFKNGAFIDIGANTGMYSFLVASINNRNPVIAFEPYNIAYELFEKNLQINMCPHIELEKIAVSNHNGQVSLFIPIQDHGLIETSSSLNSDFKTHHERIVQIKAVTLDKYIQSRHPGPIALIKIDVEGHENEVFTGGYDSIQLFRPVIVYEVLSNFKKEAIKKIIQEFGYQSFFFDGKKLVEEKDVSFIPSSWNHVLIPSEKLVDIASFWNVEQINTFPHESEFNFFIDKKGIEIGGPSSIFNRDIPIYSKARKIDGVNFSEKTLWDNRDAGINSYTYFENKIGDQYICDATNLLSIQNDSYDFILASHVLEHIANPIKALKEWIRVVKSGGKIILLVPHKNAIFDHNREYTTFEHIMEDYINDTQEDDMTHFDEIIEKHDLSVDMAAGSHEEFVERGLNNIQNRALHHHVFSLDVITQIFDFLDISIDIQFIYGINIVCIGSVTKRDK